MALPACTGDALIGSSRWSMTSTRDTVASSDAIVAASAARSTSRPAKRWPAVTRSTEGSIWAKRSTTASTP